MVSGIGELGLKLVLSSLKVLVLTFVILDNLHASCALERPSGLQYILDCISVIGLCCTKPSQTSAEVLSPSHLLGTLHIPLL